MDSVNQMIRPFKSYYFIVLAILFQALSGILAKYVAISSSNPGFFSIVLNIFYLLSVGCLVLQALSWQVALKHFDLSFSYPFLSLVNFIILVYSFVVFHEGITLWNIIGLIVITAGMIMLSRDGAPA